jgi:uncharacterized SAM-dependent methyltransferase
MTLNSGFDEKQMERYLRIKLNVSLTIRFRFANGERAINLDKGEKILVWRAKHFSTEDVLTQLNLAGFRLLAANHTDDYMHLMAVAGIRPNTRLPE